MVLTYHRAVRVVALAVIVAGLLACAGEPPRPPRDAANACLAAIDAATTTPSAVREALACRGLYRDRGCGAAWVALAAAPDPVEVFAGYQRVQERCRAACLRLSRGSPPRGCVDPQDRYGLGATTDVRRRIVEIVEIDQALHELAGLPTELAQRLALRVGLLGVTPTMFAPTALAAAPDLRDPAGTLSIHLTLDSVLVNTHAVGDGKLRELIEARGDVTAAVVEADPDVPYQRVVELLDELRSAGVTEITFQVARP